MFDNEEKLSSDETNVLQTYIPRQLTLHIF